MPLATLAATTCSLKDWFLGNNCSDRRRILLLDGGVSTHLQDLLLLSQNNNNDDSNDSNKKEATTNSFRYRELWSSSLLLDNCQEQGHSTIVQGHVDWLRAGADILSTVTYQCHYCQALWPDILLKQEDGGATMDQMIQDGIQLAKQAVQKEVLSSTSSPSFVVASLGCYGAAMANGQEYTGDYSSGDDEHNDVTATLLQYWKRKLRVFLDLHPDGVALETIPSLLECQALVQLFLSSDEMTTTTAACWISLSCKNGTQLNDGTEVTTVLEMLRQVPTTSLQAIGFNCCDSAHLPALVDILLQDMATTINDSSPVRGIVLYPNSGEEWDAAAETWRHGTGCRHANELASRLMAVVCQIEVTWKQLRPNESPPRIVLGGCCRTRPAAIARLRELVDEHLEADTATAKT